MLASGLIAVILYQRRQRRFDLNVSPLWMMFVFAFGIPGYLGWRFHDAWPVSGVQNALGEPPERNGLEIFDNESRSEPEPAPAV